MSTEIRERDGGGGVSDYLGPTAIHMVAPVLVTMVVSGGSVDERKVRVEIECGALRSSFIWGSVPEAFEWIQNELERLAK